MSSTTKAQHYRHNEVELTGKEHTISGFDVLPSNRLRLKTVPFPERHDLKGRCDKRE